MGAITGSLTIGYLNKYFSRKKIIYLNIIIFILSNFTLSIVKNYIVFSICRFLYSLSVEGFLITHINIASEYLPNKRRSLILNIVWVTFPLSMIIFLFIYKSLNPDTNKDVIFSASLYNGFFLLLIGICFFLMFNDSPRNLLIENDLKTAQVIMERIYRRKFSLIDLKNIQKNLLNSGANKYFFQKEIGFKSLFDKSIRKFTIINSLLYFLFNFSYAGINIVLPQILAKIIEDRNLNRSLLEDLTTNQLILFYGLGMICIFVCPFIIEYQICSKKLCKTIIMIASFLNVILSILFPINFYIFIGLSSFLFEFCYSMLNTYSSEMVPTVIRDYAIGFFFVIGSSSGFLSQFIFIWLLKFDKYLPVYVYISIIIIIIIIILFLPNDNDGNLDSEVLVDTDNENDVNAVRI